MELAGSISSIANGAGGLFLVALAILALAKGRRRGVNLALATFSASWGATFAIYGFLAATPEEAPWLDASVAVLEAVAAVAVVRLARSFPAPGAARDARSLALPLAVALAYVVLALVVFPRPPQSGFEGFALGARWAEWVALSALYAAMLGYLVVLAQRFPQAHDELERRQVAFTAVAIALYPGFVAGRAAFAPGYEVFALAIGVPLALVSALWIASTASAPESRVARNVALATLAAPIPGLLSGEAWVIGALIRPLAVVLLAYAILRLQILGLDDKALWTVQRSSLASFFVVTFFLVSEGAERVVEQASGKAYLGMAAAGALVFVIGPLQRLASRIAGATVLGPRTHPPSTPADRIAAYREAVRAAWSDGTLTRAERFHLDRLRVELHLSDEETGRVERDVA